MRHTHKNFARQSQLQPASAMCFVNCAQLPSLLTQACLSCSKPWTLLHPTPALPAPSFHPVHGRTLQSMPGLKWLNPAPSPLARHPSNGRATMRTPASLSVCVPLAARKHAAEEAAAGAGRRPRRFLLLRLRRQRCELLHHARKAGPHATIKSKAEELHRAQVGPLACGGGPDPARATHSKRNRAAARTAARPGKQSERNCIQAWRRSCMDGARNCEIRTGFTWARRPGRLAPGRPARGWCPSAASAAACHRPPRWPPAELSVFQGLSRLKV